jgi:TetR/AcrR family transcriptional regulator, regulator of biofilm formation and stress response
VEGSCGVRARPRSDATRLALLNAALDVAAEYGVKGVTHRRVASAAGLSLGLTSYHFANLDDLLLEAFRLFVSHTSALYERQFHEATDLESMIDAALAVVNALKDSARERTLLYELYAQSVRDPAYRELVVSWAESARAGVERLYSARTARFLEAAWEGANAQLIQGRDDQSDDELRALFRLILLQDSNELTGGTTAATRRG